MVSLRRGKRKNCGPARRNYQYHPLRAGHAAKHRAAAQRFVGNQEEDREAHYQHLFHIRPGACWGETDSEMLDGIGLNRVEMARAMKEPLRKTKPATSKALAVVPNPGPAHQSSFREVLRLIQRARQRAYQAVNTELIDLYWRVGQFISRKLGTAEWGEKVVGLLAEYIHR